MKKGLSRYVLTDEIYALLKRQIMNHEIPPGEKINIDQLARELEVSNIPIREALSRLTAEGLVHMVPFKGMYATEMTLQELDEIFEIRMNLETLALSKAAPLIPDNRIRDIVRDMEEWSNNKPTENEEKLQRIAEMNRNLHGLLLQYCDNETLKKLINMYIERIHRYLSFIHKEMELQVIEEEWAEHMLVVNALVSRDFDGAANHLLQHLKNSHIRTRNFFL
ncbi:GntR family transcriptional regulator [Paenibacillus lignilyticus]|uniref:GntR family transcriptional regulator n=1 Tax=Paenibacillus lignilyticus TaxID=1172615 RepID=A0ABS5CA30_9BACL|nr:GntR family transcriptional regulator [Paenibacillus lignilyticus]MBP3962841.1 GntR family transcriptional regulator [Paenibacillus lignilyticus]